MRDRVYGLLLGHIHWINASQQGAVKTLQWVLSPKHLASFQCRHLPWRRQEMVQSPLECSHPHSELRAICWWLPFSVPTPEEVKAAELHCLPQVRKLLFERLTLQSKPASLSQNSFWRWALAPHFSWIMSKGHRPVSHPIHICPLICTTLVYSFGSNQHTLPSQRKRNVLKWQAIPDP